MLLTKIDQYCARALNGLPVDHSLGNLTALELAERLDPIETARSLLGVPILRSIQSAMKLEATLAIGVSSAGGFQKNGVPFLDANGSVVSQATAKREELFKDWTPFGVREAVHFLVFGTESSKIRFVRPDDLLVDDSQFAAPIYESNLQY